MASLLQIGFEPLWKKSKVSSLENYRVSSVEYPDPVIHWSQAVCVFPQGAEKSVWLPVDDGSRASKVSTPEEKEIRAKVL